MEEKKREHEEIKAQRHAKVSLKMKKGKFVAGNANVRQSLYPQS